MPKTKHRTKHVATSKVDVVKYKIVNLIGDSQRIVSCLSHFGLLIWKIYKQRSCWFISSYAGYYLSFLLIFTNYIFYLTQTPNIAMITSPQHTPDLRLGPTVNLRAYKFVIDHPAVLQTDQFFENFSRHFQKVCQLNELLFIDRQKRNSKASRLQYKKLKKQYGQQLLGRLLMEYEQGRANFTIEIDNYQLKMDYFQDFPFVTDRFNLFNFEFGLNKSRFIEIENCIVQAMLSQHGLANIVFQIDDLNKQIDVKKSFFYFLPLIITIGWLPNCLSITGEKLRESHSNLRRLYRVCGLDSFTYHLSYTAYIFLSLMVQTIFFIIILYIINLPFYFRIVLNTGTDKKMFPVKFHKTLIDLRVFFNIMICYNLAVALHVQLFSLLYKSKAHFYFSFTIYTFFSSLLPFDILTTYLKMPFHTITDQLRQTISSRFVIIYSTFLFCPSSALIYALRQIEDMSYVENALQSNDISNLQTFESLSFYQITIHDVLLIFLTYSCLCGLLILNHDLGLFGFIGKLLFLDMFKWNLNAIYNLQIIDQPDQQVLLRMTDLNSQQRNCNCSVNNEDHANCVNRLKDLNMQAKANELVVILSNKYKAKEHLFRCLLGEVKLRSDALFLEKYRPNAFIKPLFVNCFPTRSTGVCFEEDLFDNPLSLVENLSIYSRLKASQFATDTSDVMLLLHLLRLKDVKRVPVSLLNKNLKRKLAVAVALLGSQRILILNEPMKGTDLETSKLIWETLVKLKHDKLIIVLTTNTRLNFHGYADQLYVLNNCELFHAGSLHQLMNSTHSGIQLVFRKLNNNYSLAQIEEFLDGFFGEKEFALVCSNNNRLIWYSYNIQLIHQCNEFRDEFEQIGDELNVQLERIRVSRMKLNLNANHQKPEPIAYEQNPNVFFVGQTRVSKRRPDYSVSCQASSWGRDLLYCLRINLFSLDTMLADLMNLALIFLLVLCLLNVFHFHPFAGRSFASPRKDLPEKDLPANDDEPENLKALDFSSSAVMNNLLVYVVQTKQDSFELSNLNFSTQALVDYLNARLSKALNTHQFVCIWMYDPFRFAHEQQFNLALIEKHLGGILKLNYNINLDGLRVELDHNSRFPYLLLQILDLFTNFVIDSPAIGTANGKVQADGSTKSRKNGPPPEKRFNVNLQFNENKGLRFLYKNLLSRVSNFFLLTCILFCSSILLNQNLVLYLRRRSSIIGHVKKLKNVSAAIYWTSSLISDQLVGMLCWLGLLLIVVVLNSLSPSVIISFMEFSLVFYVLYSFILTASLIFLFYVVYLATSSLKSYLVLMGEICFLTGFMMPLIASNIQYYIEDYYEKSRALYDFFKVSVALGQFLSPIFNFVWTIDKIQSYHSDLRLCANFDVSYTNQICNRNMTNFNYVLNVPLAIDRIYKCCSSNELVFTHYLNDIFSTSFPLLLLNCIVTGLFLIFIDALYPVGVLVRLKH